MPATQKNRRFRHKSITLDDSPRNRWSAGQWCMLILLLIAIVCVAMGLIVHGFPGWAFLTYCVCLIFGLGCIAIGLVAEFAWLEWIINFTDGIISGIWGWFWTKNLGTLSENVGERGASVLWLAVGIPSYLAGCLMALRIIPV